MIKTAVMTTTIDEMAAMMIFAFIAFLLAKYLRRKRNHPRRMIMARCLWPAPLSIV
jgi:uncharacterized membrane protein